MLVALVAMTVVALVAIVSSLFIIREQAAQLQRAYEARAAEVRDLQDRLGRLIGQEMLSPDRIEELRKSQAADLADSEGRRLWLRESEIDYRLADRQAPDGADLPARIASDRIAMALSQAVEAE